MVGEEEVTDINEYNDLPASKGQLVPLKPKGNFGSRPHPEWTYFIRDAEAIKIGRSIHPRSRLRALQGANGSKLELLLTVPCSRLSEAEAHRKFRHLRSHLEWFRPEQELLDFIEALRAEIEPRPRRKRPPPHVEMMIGRLVSARPSAPPHKRNHISNLIEQLRNHASATDPGIRSFLERAMARSMTRIEAA